MRICMSVNRTTYLEAIVAATSLCENNYIVRELTIEEKENDQSVRDVLADALSKYNISISFVQKRPALTDDYIDIPTNIIFDGNAEAIFNPLSQCCGKDNIKNYVLVAPDAHNQGLTYNDIKGKEKIILYPENRPWQCGDVHYDIERIWWEYAKKTPVYDTLMKLFLESAMTDTTLEDYAIKLDDENNRLITAIEDTKASLDRFINMGVL